MTPILIGSTRCVHAASNPAELNAATATSWAPPHHDRSEPAINVFSASASAFASLYPIRAHRALA